MRYFSALVQCCLWTSLCQLRCASSLPRYHQDIHVSLQQCMERRTDTYGRDMVFADWLSDLCFVDADFVVLPRSALLAALAPSTGDAELAQAVTAGHTREPHGAKTARLEARTRRDDDDDDEKDYDDLKEELEELEDERDELAKELTEMKHARAGYIISIVGIGVFALVLAGCLIAQVLRVKRGKKKYRTLSQDFSKSQVALDEQTARDSPEQHLLVDQEAKGGSQDQRWSESALYGDAPHSLGMRKEGNASKPSVVTFNDTDTMVSADYKPKPGGGLGWGHSRYDSYGSARSSDDDSTRDGQSSRPASRAGRPPSRLGAASPSLGVQR